MHARFVAVGLGACLALIALGLTIGLIRVYHLERSEIEHEGPARPLSAHRQAPGSTKVSARLAELDLRAGRQAVFEVCSADGLPDAWRDAIGFAVFQLQPMRLMLRVELDAPHLARVERGPAGGCLQLGSGRIEHSGRYSVDAVWPDRPLPEALARVPIRARVLARQPLTPADRWLVGAIAVGGLLLLALGWSQPWSRPWGKSRSRPRTPLEGGTSATASATVSAQDTNAHGTAPMRPPYPWIAAALFGVFAAGQLPLWGPTLGLSKGLIIASVQVLTALLWIRRRRGIPLRRPKRPWPYLIAALAACPLLVANARWSLRFVPSTGEAPIETFISWPSGMLTFALLGALLPLVEELFFRGFLFGSLLGIGKWPAAAASLVLFWVLHLQQSWGNWGALWAIFATGLVATGLRLGSGSVLPGALAHMLYNLVLSLRL